MGPAKVQTRPPNDFLKKSEQAKGKDSTGWLKSIFLVIILFYY